LPAETHACATSCLTRLIATRIDESFLRRRSVCGRLVHLDDFGGRLQRAADRAPAICASQSAALIGSSSPTGDHARSRALLEELECPPGASPRGRDRPHRVNGYRDRHGDRSGRAGVEAVRARETRVRGAATSARRVGRAGARRRFRAAAAVSTERVAIRRPWS
jgi:hypothetical protein